jgi:hypothetical protein
LSDFLAIFFNKKKSANPCKKKSPNLFTRFHTKAKVNAELLNGNSQM